MNWYLFLWYIAGCLSNACVAWLSYRAFWRVDKALAFIIVFAFAIEALGAFMRAAAEVA